MTSLAYPKPVTRRTVQARKRRAEAAVIAKVRAACVERDGYCRFHRQAVNDWYVQGGWYKEPGCEGPAEWAHLRGHRRSHTRGQAPGLRHTTTHSLMLCRRHHGMEERGDMRVKYLTEQGCDGPLRFSYTEGVR